MELNKEQVEHFSLQFAHFYKEDEDLGVGKASLPHCICFCLQRSHYFAKQFVVNTRPKRSLPELKNSFTFPSATALAKVREYQRDRIKARMSMSTKQKHEEAMKSNKMLNKLLFSAYMPTVSFAVWHLIFSPSTTACISNPVIAMSPFVFTGWSFNANTRNIKTKKKGRTCVGW